MLRTSSNLYCWSPCHRPPTELWRLARNPKQRNPVPSRPHEFGEKPKKSREHNFGGRSWGDHLTQTPTSYHAIHSGPWTSHISQFEYHSQAESRFKDARTAPNINQVAPRADLGAQANFRIQATNYGRKHPKHKRCALKATQIPNPEFKDKRGYKPHSASCAEKSCWTLGPKNIATGDLGHWGKRWGYLQRDC